MKKWYLFDSLGAAMILLFSFIFQSFNVGYYSFRSFLSFAIGSLIIGFIRNQFHLKAALWRSLIGFALILALSVSIIKMFPIPIRDIGDVVMPYINACINAFIYFFITNILSLLEMKRKKKFC